MTSSSLLQSVVELAMVYLVQSTLFLGGVACALLVMTWRQRKQSAATAYSVSPVIEERLWKLAAVLPILTVPLAICAGWSCPISSWSPQSPSVVMAEDESADATAVAFDDQQPLLPTLEEPMALNPDAPEASVFSIEETPQFAPELVEQAVTLSSEPPTISPTTNFESPLESTAPADALIASTQEPLATNEPAAAWRWQSLLGLALLLVIALSLVRLAIRSFLIHRFLKQCSPADESLYEILNRLTTCGRKIRILHAKTDAVAEPFACGIWRWTIVLPDGIDQQLKPAEMRALLAHEVAHLLRRDPLWLFIGEFLCTGLAIQPLNFFARRRWLQVSELLCDDWAVERNVSATSLATCLTKIAELRLNHRARAWGLAAIGRSGLLSRRVEWLLRSNRESEPKRRRRSFQVTAAVFALGVLVGTFGPRFVLEAPLEAAVETEIDADRAAILNELSIALDELQQTELLLTHDSDPNVVAAAARLRTRVRSIRESLSK